MLVHWVGMIMLVAGFAFAFTCVMYVCACIYLFLCALKLCSCIVCVCISALKFYCTIWKVHINVHRARHSTTLNQVAQSTHARTNTHTHAHIHVQTCMCILCAYQAHRCSTPLYHLFLNLLLKVCSVLWCHYFRYTRQLKNTEEAIDYRLVKTIFR